MHRIEKKIGKLTSSLNEAMVVLTREQRVRQISEKLLEQASNAVHIMKEVCRVTEIDLMGV